MWYFDGPIGELYIVEKDGNFYLRFNDEYFGPYQSTVGAADDVYLQHTGCSRWDNLKDVGDVPTDIREWVWLQDPQ